MPFINLTKKKDQDEQKVVPADLAEPVTSDTTAPVADAPVEPVVEAQVTADAAPAAEGGDVDHLKSKEVPTSLPGQEVEVTDEGVKEIKGPALPGEAQAPAENLSAEPVVPEAVSETPVTDSVPMAEPVTDPAQVLDPVAPSDAPVDAPVDPIVAAPEATVAPAVDPAPVETPDITEQPATTVDSVVQSADNAAASEINLADKLPAIEGLASEAPAPTETTENAAPEETMIQSLDPNVSTIDNYFDLVLTKNASDLHFGVGYPVFIRVDGTLERIGTTELTSEAAEKLIYSVLNEDQKKAFLAEKELDLSYEYKKDARFRINVFFEKGHLAAAFRYLPTKIRTIEELKLPQIVHEFIQIPQGLILVTGPTGSGKSTTIASMVQEINDKQKKHIITIEDPIEYVYPKGAALVDQRELEKDTHNWANALRSVLRQDPNVVVVGEMRDLETIAAAITVSETGHMVYATLHTNTAVQTIDRIIDVFPPHQQAQIRSQLSNVISAVISQRLIPVKAGGRRAVVEIMIGTAAVRNAIREGKTYQIDNIIQTSFDVGMITLERGLVDLIREGELTVEEAQKHTTKPEELIRLMKKA